MKHRRKSNKSKRETDRKKRIVVLVSPIRVATTCKYMCMCVCVCWHTADSTLGSKSKRETCNKSSVQWLEVVCQGITREAREQESEKERKKREGTKLYW